MLAMVFSGFVVAALLPWLHRRIGDKASLVAALCPLAATLWLASGFVGVTSGDVITAYLPWMPTLGLDLAFRLDGLSLLFALMISGIGTLVVLYTHGYLHGDPRQHRFVMYTLMFMASMLGVVTADNLILLFIFWELTSFTSFLLIGFNHDEEASRRAALQAMLVTVMGGLFLLAGVLLIGRAVGTFSLSAVVASRDLLVDHPHYPVMLGLVLVGAFTKSAQAPFHFWLPNAMAAPTPASAYLHSSTMVKAGVYLLARLHPALGGTEAWTLTLTGFGALTLLTGAVMAAGQVYLKRLLAYTTVAALGALVMLLGIGTEAAVEAAMVFLMAHACYKAALFLVAGSIDHETGEKNVTKLGGLFRYMPITGATALVAALSMAGVPSAFGFISKELQYAVLFQHGWLPVVAVVSGAFFLLVAVQTGIRPFWARYRETPKHAHEPPWTMTLGPVLLGVITVAGGLFPGWTADALAGAAASATAFAPVDMHLHVWHGFNRELMASLATLALGGIVVLVSPRLAGLGNRMAGLARLGPDRGYDGALRGLLSLAKWQTKALQSGSLRRYLMIILLTVIALFAVSFARSELSLQLRDRTPLTLPMFILCALIVVASIAAAVSASRLGAVAAMGVVGFSIALVFVLFGAPDLAMTQLVIETLSVVLLVSAFYYLPAFTRRSTWRGRARDLLVSIFAGVVMTLLVLLATGVSVGEPISDYFAATSVPLGHGRNIVNVILVDYRALDTLGEITVLAVAGLGALALLKLRTKNGGGES
ncbi:MAG TPA: putative monovalent cation/H+ antiporter subunit A [Kiritimatiellia bacterium]|nr:putative monovalent cation/H+ antiporter subunit A [Kiritimatiellia bacterium]HMO99263.1 putative monovalent cation/H+ antiporter subunit A [Kiritimatiellia bacterium]HMP96945.1 putative monovalent cation/H+ antiporter subunit A [Kiritimatiellia bacterium]